MDTSVSDEIICRVVRPTKSIPTLPEDVVKGLFDGNKELPPKYFYDDRGSELFDQICDEPEYYPTRTEDQLLRQSARAIIERSEPSQIVEFGSGMSRKTRHIFDACDEVGCQPTYVPFDVCDDVLIKSGTNLVEKYEWLEVEPLVGDYTAGLGNLPLADGPKLLMFLGGTIGNFTAEQAHTFLSELRTLMTKDDFLLIGADRIKDPEALHAAYNDDAGITAAFNLNLLDVLNRELDADFDPQQFEHYAFYNPDQAQIEMHLVCMKNQTIRIQALQRSLDLKEGDAIRTEISRKFTRDSLEQLLDAAGFNVRSHFESSGQAFSLVLAELAR